MKVSVGLCTESIQ
jgi:hypothetical protein